MSKKRKFKRKKKPWETELEVTGSFCPRCLRKLIFKQRHSDKKYFVGCSSWPDCHYTRNLFDGEL